MGMHEERVEARRMPRTLRAVVACLIAAALAWVIAVPAASAAEASGSLLDELLGQPSSEGAVTVVEEAGLMFELPPEVYLADDGWWTYLSDTEALYFQTTAAAAGGPANPGAAPDEAWVGQIAAERGYEPLGSIPYANETVSFCAYFFYDGSLDEPYVDFYGFVPLADGTVSALAGFFRCDGEIDAMLDMLDAVFASVELADGAVQQEGEIVIGSFAFTLPADVEFEHYPEAGAFAFAGPAEACILTGAEFEVPAGSIATVDDLQVAGDEFMSGVATGAGVEDGEVLGGGVWENGNGISYYEASFISSEMDVRVGLIPYNDEMSVLLVIDTGGSDDFSYAGDVFDALMDTARFSEEAYAALNGATDENEGTRDELDDIVDTVTA